METNAVICNRKSNIRATPAYKANALTAGMSLNPPKKKQRLSDMTLRRMEDRIKKKIQVQ